jgi:hypothetical protein
VRIDLLVGVLLAQVAAPVDSSGGSDLERIRKALAESPAIIVLAPSVRREGLVFRVRVHGSIFDHPIWQELSFVPSYVRPGMPLYHYEFLQQVTPEDFRAGTLYPVGIPVVPLMEFLGKRISVAQRKAREERARVEVRQALEDLLACRANPSRPGC